MTIICKSHKYNLGWHLSNSGIKGNTGAAMSVWRASRARRLERPLSRLLSPGSAHREGDRKLMNNTYTEERKKAPSGESAKGYQKVGFIFWCGDWRKVFVIGKPNNSLRGFGDGIVEVRFVDMKPTYLNQITFMCSTDSIRP